MRNEPRTEGHRTAFPSTKKITSCPQSRAHDDVACLWQIESDSECSDESSSSESEKEDLVIASSDDDSTEGPSQD